MYTHQLTIIGGGNLGSALAKGLINSGKYNAQELVISKREVSTLEELRSRGVHLTTYNKAAVKASSIVVLAVLPQKINEVLHEINDSLSPDQLLISVVTGVHTQDIKAIVGADRTVVRAMPNTAISIMQSMTCIAAEGVGMDVLVKVQHIFDAVGKTIIINEDKMTSATALNACGIAFFLRAIRAATQGGTEIDFHAEEALFMAAQTAKGAAMLLLENHSHPEEEIDKVTSPKGCTIAGLNHMEHSGFSSAFIKGITTSAEKAKELYCK
jgi:pyrroline-5-carboxylate reductase